MLEKQLFCMKARCAKQNQTASNGIKPCCHCLEAALVHTTEGIPIDIVEHPHQADTAARSDGLRAQDGANSNDFTRRIDHLVQFILYSVSFTIAYSERTNESEMGRPTQNEGVQCPSTTQAQLDLLRPIGSRAWFELGIRALIIGPVKLQVCSGAAPSDEGS